MEKEYTKLLIVFDLDETLLFTRLKRENSFYKEQEDFCINLEDAVYKVFIRSGAKELIEYCQQTYNVGIWSSAKSDYVESLAEKLFDREKLLFIWHREHCDQEKSEYFENTVVKNLNKLPYPNRKDFGYR